MRSGRPKGGPGSGGNGMTRRASVQGRGAPPHDLVAAARAACRTAQPRCDGAPPRAAAISASSGVVYTGSDTDSPVGDGSVVPAEQIALYKAVMAGERSLLCLILCAGMRGTADGGPPDGATLQILHEFAPRMRVHWGSAGRFGGGAEVRDLLPGAFTGDDLDRAVRTKGRDRA